VGSIYLNGTTPGYPSIDQVIRDAGLALSLWDGWEWNTRSSGGFEQLLGIVVHHTASGSGTSFQNDWSYCAAGHQDAPVANLLLGRDGQVGLHSGGASNHAGKGGPWLASGGTVPLDSGNSRMIGIEAQNNGVGELWSAEMLGCYELLVAALCEAYGLLPATDVPAHFEWAPSRKVDPWGGSLATAGYPYTGPREWDMGGFTANVAALMAGEVPPQEDDMAMTIFTVEGAGAAFLGFTDTKGLGQTVEWLDTQAKLDLYRAQHCPELHIGLADCHNLYLLGPVPAGDHRHPWARGDFRGVIDTA